VLYLDLVFAYTLLALGGLVGWCLIFYGLVGVCGCLGVVVGCNILLLGVVFNLTWWVVWVLNAVVKGCLRVCVGFVWLYGFVVIVCLGYLFCGIDG